MKACRAIRNSGRSPLPLLKTRFEGKCVGHGLGRVLSNIEARPFSRLQKACSETLSLDPTAGKPYKEWAEDARNRKEFRWLRGLL